MGQEVREQLSVRWRNDRVVPASKDKHGSLDAWKKRFQAREVARVSPNILRRLLEPPVGGRQPVILQNRAGERACRRGSVGQAP